MNIAIVRSAAVACALLLSPFAMKAQNVDVHSLDPRVQGSVYEISDVDQNEAEELFSSAEAAAYFPELRRVRWFDVGAPSLREPKTLAEFTTELERDYAGFRSNSFGPYLLKLPSRSIALPNSATEDAASPNATLLTDSFESGLGQWQLANNTSGAYNFAVMGCQAHSGAWSADPVRGGATGMYSFCSTPYPANVTTQITHAACDGTQGASQAWLDFYLTSDMDTSETLGVYYQGTDGYIWGYGFVGSWTGWFHIVLNLKQWNHLGDVTTVACAKTIFQFRSDAAATLGTGALIDDVTIRTDPPSTLRCAMTATPVSGPAPLKVTFTPTVAGATGAETYEWRFGDSASSSSTTKSATFTYTAAGEYWPRLRVSDGNTRAYAHARITVTAASPCTVACTAAVPSTGKKGNAVPFAATATPSGCTGSATYTWNFGDGQTSTQQNPSHVYATAGSYNWSMTASAGGTSCLKNGAITISAATPTPRRRALVLPPPGAATEILVQPSASAQTFTSGDLSVTVPGGLLTSAKSLKITKLTSAPPANFSGKKVGGAFEVTLGDLRTFAKPLIIRMKYTASALRTDLAPERAVVGAYYDKAQGVWVEVPTTVDKTKQEIIVGTNHLTTWGWVMWAAGYPLLQNSTFTMSWDKAEMNDPLRGPVYTAADTSYHVDPNVPDYVEDAFAYLGIAFQRYKSAGFKVPPTPINVWVGGSDPSQRAKFFGHGLTINLNSMTQPQLKMDTAHELFHSFEGSYLTAVGMGTGELPIIGWAPPVLSWSVWYVEAAAEYAAEHVAWDGTLKQMGRNLRKDYLSYPVSDVSANHDYGYTTAHFIKYLVGQGASFKGMSEYLFGYDWLNANDYYYPMHEYLEKTIGSGKGLPRQFQAFARHFVFDPASPMPPVTDSLYSEVAAYRSTNGGKSDSVTFTLPGGYTAKVWGNKFSDSLFSATTTKLKYGVGVTTLPAKVEIDVYLLKGDKRVTGGGLPAGTITQTNKSVAIEVEKGDAVYVMAVSTDSASQSVTVKLEPISTTSTYAVKVSQVTACGDGNGRDWGTWGFFIAKWSGNNFTYTETKSETDQYGTVRLNETAISGTLSADRKTLTSMSIEIHGKETYPSSASCPSAACIYEVWKSVALANVPAAADWSTAFLHFESKGAGARPKITKFVNRVLSSGWSRDNFDCTYPIDESKLDMIELVVLVQ